MNWTPEQLAVLTHPLDAHAVVRAVPGAGKTTTLVGRVVRLVELGVDPARVRVVMFNKAIQETFRERLATYGVNDVRVTTFDALGLEVLKAAARQGLLTRPLQVVPEASNHWAREVWRPRRDRFDSPDEIASAVAFWKAHLVPPTRAAFKSEPALVEAYAAWEELRLSHDTLRVGYEDMVYTAVGVLGRHPRLLGPIDHLLVDELQDVNPGRVELVRRLSHPGTSIVAVGDEDQGVNEWCGAHPRYFRAFADTFPSLPTREYALSRSFRFGAVLAEAANRVIRNNADRAPLHVVGGGQTEGVLAEVDDVADAVLRLFADGWEPADVAVLYRGRGQGAGAIAALAGAGIPMRTDDIGLLRKGRGPELALGYLRHATSTAPVKLEDVWPIVHAPDRYIGKEPFAAQVRQLGAHGLRVVLRDTSLAASLGQNRGGIKGMRDLAAVLDAMGRAGTAGEALDRLVAAVDVEAQLRAWLRAEKDQELAIATFHAVHALLRGLKVAPSEAGAALENLDATRGTPPERCVWVSTIHKAKGLEWRCVVLPGLIEGACPAERRGSVPGTVDEPDGVPQSDWMEQERRIFYVGLTRAIDQALLHAPGDAPSRFVAEAKGQRARPLTPIPSVRAVMAEIVGTDRERPRAAGKSWTAADDEVLADAWEAGEGLAVLAERMGRSTSGVAARLVRLGLVEDRAEARRRR